MLTVHLHDERNKTAKHSDTQAHAHTVLASIKIVAAHSHPDKQFRGREHTLLRPVAKTYNMRMDIEDTSAGSWREQRCTRLQAGMCAGRTRLRWRRLAWHDCMSVISLPATTVNKPLSA
jgi:hypothetical protein